MADKTEVQLKAVEKRLDVIERSIETLKKDSGSNDSAAQLKALGTKLDTLTATVKELGIQMVLKKDLKTATKLEADEKDRENKVLEIRMQAEAKSRADKETATRVAEMKEQKAQTDKIIADQKAMVEKMVSEQTINTRFLKLETEFQGRVKTLELQMATVMKR